MKYIIPTNSKKLIKVDDEDYKELIKYKWHLSHNRYAVTGNQLRVRGTRKFNDINRLNVYMHRLVFDRYKDSYLYVDHIDGDTCNNQKSNLRYATNQQNQANRKGNKNNKSGYRGVTWDSLNNKWVAQVMFNRKNIKIGRYKDIEDAHKAYKQKAEELFGKYLRKLPN